jgi:galactitol-specific phosphotransferase system IIB component
VEASSLACGLTLVTSSVLCVASQVQAVQQTMHVTTYQQEQVQETGERLAGYDVSQTTSALAGYDVLETATTSQTWPVNAAAA